MALSENYCIQKDGKFEKNFLNECNVPKKSVIKMVFVFWLVS